LRRGCAGGRARAAGRYAGCYVRTTGSGESSDRTLANDDLGVLEAGEVLLLQRPFLPIAEQLGAESAKLRFGLSTREAGRFSRQIGHPCRQGI
jgi:hypothetical protein